MKYNEWRDELKNNLLSCSESERQRVLDYYAEAYADRREAGFSEREIIEEFGAPYDAAHRILTETAKAEADEIRAVSTPPVQPEPEATPTPVPTPSPAATYTEQPKTAPTPVIMPHPLTEQSKTAGQTKTAAKKSNTGLIVGLVCGFIALIIIILAITLPTLAVKGLLHSRIHFTTESHTATEENTALTVNINAGTLKTEFYDGDKIIIEYPVADQYSVSIKEESGVLTYTAKLKHIPFWISYSIPDTVIKLPQSVSMDVVAVINAGSAYLADGKYNDVNLTVDAGEIEITNIECASLNAEVNAGSFYAKQITCPAFTCVVNMGEIDVDKIDCQFLKAEVNMGSLTVGIAGTKSEYNITANCDMGSSNISSQTVAGAEKSIVVSVNMGELDVAFDK